MRTGLLLAAIACALVASVAASTAKQPQDYAAVALNILPPGESGSLAFPPNATDQAKLYDALTPLAGNVTAADLTRYFKRESFGLDGEKPVKTERPRAGVTILRDSFGVAHVYGRTAEDVGYGAGYASAEDRALLLLLLREPARLAVLDAPGLDPTAVAISGRAFTPSAQTEAVMASEVKLLRSQGADGRRAVAILQSYVTGINAEFKAAGLNATWTMNDSVAMTSLIAAIFGAGGGDEVRRSEFLDALEKRLGASEGRQVWEDLRERDDADAPVSVPGVFHYDDSSTGEQGNAMVDDGSFQPVPSLVPSTAPERRSMSNALLVGAKRSATGHPLFVAGSQVGYTYPESLLELDLHGGGFDARGVSQPGTFGIVLGRGKDFAFGAMSENGDVVDQFVETLCNGDDVHYMFKGQCRPMTVFDAGTLGAGGGKSAQEIVFRETVHGPVVGYATVAGRRVAITSDRSTRGRELLNGLVFVKLNRNEVHTPQDFIRAFSGLELTFNWVYADSKHIAYYSSGRLPIRAPGVDPGLPTIGTGDYEWRGFLSTKAHPQAIDPPSGVIVGWNNKPARGFVLGDDSWEFGSVHRVDLLQNLLAARNKHTLTSVVAAMNTAATQDLRVMIVEPTLASVLRTGPALNARDAKMLDLLDAWRAAGGSRLDRDGDGKIDDPGAAIMDAAWPKFADAVLSPVLGALTDQLAALMKRDEHPSTTNGSSFEYGWYEYVDKDLRTLLGQPVKAPFHVHYCGRGDLSACRASLWQALDAAGNELQAAQGPDPAAWRADATKERITFGLLPLTMRWTNRPTFQQVITFRSHRGR